MRVIISCVCPLFPKDCKLPEDRGCVSFSYMSLMVPNAFPHPTAHLLKVGPSQSRRGSLEGHLFGASGDSASVLVWDLPNSEAGDL